MNWKDEEARSGCILPAKQRIWTRRTILIRSKTSVMSVLAGIVAGLESWAHTFALRVAFQGLTFPITGLHDIWHRRSAVQGGG